VDDPIGQCHIREAGIPYTQTGFPPEESASVYWEPLADAPLPPQLPGTPQVRWDLWAGENTGDEGVQAHLRADYTIPSQANPTMGLPRYYNQEFVIKTRELSPNGDTNDEGGTTPLQGSDVAMLEAMLWQLGISPQWGFPGSQGTRIDAIAPVLEQCDPALPKNTFSAGWENRVNAAQLCQRREASVEAMVRRFQARHNVPVANGYAGSNTISNQSGILDEQSLVWLANAWRQYWAATRDHPRGFIRSTDIEVDPWLAEAINVWQQGLEQSDPQGNRYVPSTYTNERHRNVRALAGQVEASADPADETVDDRARLLRQWMLREARSHWGGGDPETEFRITEGGADEYGSMSFNQVVYQYRYADAPCTVHAEVGLNYFDPRENLLGFAVHTSGRQGTNDERCGGSFWRAFVATSEEVDGQSRPGRLAARRDRGNLRGYRHGNGNIVSVQAQAWEDDYELLAKAIGLYNGGAHAMTGARAWSTLLREYQPSTDSSGAGNEGVNCYSCRYSTAVRNNQDAYGLPHRTYIWHGGTYDDEMPLLTEDGTPQVDENGERILDPRAGQDWCFAFGESEWMGGISFEVAFNTARGDALAEPPVPAVGRINCITGENIDD